MRSGGTLASTTMVFSRVLLSLATACFSAVLLASLAARGAKAEPSAAALVAVSDHLPRSEPSSCARIVSLAPSITEVLSRVGLEPQLVGVSRYCRTETSVQRVGAFLDPNLEQIVALGPSIVFLLAEQQDFARSLAALNMRAELVDHRSVDGIVASIKHVGELCAVSAEASALSAKLAKTISQARAHPYARRARVLIVLGGESFDGSLTQIFVSGNDGFYDQLVSLAGGENVFHSRTVAVPTLSREGLYALDPEVIFYIASELPSDREGKHAGLDQDSSDSAARAAHEHDLLRSRILQGWSRFPRLKAVRDDRIFVFSGPEASIPGPQFVELLEQFRAALATEAHG